MGNRRNCLRVERTTEGRAKHIKAFWERNPLRKEEEAGEGPLQHLEIYVSMRKHRIGGGGDEQWARWEETPRIGPGESSSRMKTHEYPQKLS